MSKFGVTGSGSVIVLFRILTYLKKSGFRSYPWTKKNQNGSGSETLVKRTTQHYFQNYLRIKALVLHTMQILVFTLIPPYSISLRIYLIVNRIEPDGVHRLTPSSLLGWRWLPAADLVSDQIKLTVIIVPCIISLWRINLISEQSELILRVRRGCLQWVRGGIAIALS